MKKQSRIKWLILGIIYLLVFPVTLIVIKLVPYVIANNTNLKLQVFALAILRHPLATLLGIMHSNYALPFLLLQILIVIMLYIFLHPNKHEPFEVVGRTNPVHGSSYWGKETELNDPEDFHLVQEKSMESILKKSMRGRKDG